jgi:hypothetical protein
VDNVAMALCKTAPFAGHAKSLRLAVKDFVDYLRRSRYPIGQARYSFAALAAATVPKWGCAHG